MDEDALIQQGNADRVSSAREQMVAGGRRAALGTRISAEPRAGRGDFGQILEGGTPANTPLTPSTH